MTNPVSNLNDTRSVLDMCHGNGKSDALVRSVRSDSCDTTIKFFAQDFWAYLTRPKW